MDTMRKNSKPGMLVRRRRFSLSNMPIRYRLPLLIGILLLGIFSASALASYRVVRESSLEIGRERLRNLTQQFASLSQQSSANGLNKSFAVANDSVIRAFLRSPSPLTKGPAIAILQQFGPAQDPNSLQVELWNVSGSVALTIPEGSSPERASLETEFKQCAIDPFRAAGALRIVNDTVTAPTVAAVRDDAGKPMGYLVRWRKVGVNPDPGRLKELLGNQATLYFGNSQGDVWTDLTRAVPRPPVNLGSSSEVTQYIRRDGNSVMALGRPISGTPWSVVIEISDQVFVSQARAFLRRIALIGLVLLGVGVAGAFALSSSITRPLQSLIQAASAVSSGDYSRTVDLHRADELGVLAGVFNAMVVEVRDSQRELERKALLFEDSPLPMWVFDRETFVFLAVNEAAVRNYGFSRQEFLAMTIKDIRPPEEVPKVSRALSHPVAGLERSGIWRHWKKDGRIIDVEITTHSIDFNGRPAELVLANEVTERIRAQEALRNKSDELAAITQQLWQVSKLATMGELAASIAHELNNPLATVSLRVEALLDQLSQDEKKRQSLEVINGEVERMANLVTNLLQFTRRSHRQISTIDVRNEITNSIEFVGYYLRNRKIEVVKEFQDSLPAIHADRQQLRQLFLNLVTNATDAMPDGGTLTVRASLLNSETGIVIDFADTGQGIPTEVMARIWEPFYTSKPEGKGTGLGLPICRRIVEEHGGSISLDSKVSEGTTVTVILPTANHEDASASKAEEALAVGSKIDSANGDKGSERAMCAAAR
jgi:PAS domain S-box-containing protein